MEINTLNEQFNVLWDLISTEDHKDLRLKINELILVAKEKDSLILIGGEKHPYEPHKIIPISYDGETEYIHMNGDKLVLYRDPRILTRVGGIELSRSRLIVYPSTAVQWLLGGTDDQVAFVTKYKDIIGINL